MDRIVLWTALRHTSQPTKYHCNESWTIWDETSHQSCLQRLSNLLTMWLLLFYATHLRKTRTNYNSNVQ